MKVVLLYESSEAPATALRDTLVRLCASRGDELRIVDASGAALKPCTGCFGCWIRTPGICIHSSDGGAAFLKKLVDADRFVIASRITWGGYSQRIKGYVDRIIPLSHPYFRKVNGEMHHVRRYPTSAAIFAAGYGALDVLEESTFRDYVDSNRDHSAVDQVRAVCILDEKAPDACAAWLEREVLA